jgi:hypothetical protein
MGLRVFTTCKEALADAQAENRKLRAALEDCIPYIEGRVGDPVAIVNRALAALANERVTVREIT